MRLWTPKKIGVESKSRLQEVLEVGLVGIYVVFASLTKR